MVNLKIVSQVVTAGTPGPAGKSAYQAAVDNGFEGTEKEWLDSLLPFKGWYTSENDLLQKQPHPLFGDYAYVYTNSGTFLYHCTTNDGEGTWTNSGTQVDTSNINTFATSEPLNTVGISTDLSDAGQDEYLVKQSLITRSMAEMRCTSLGLDPIKEIPNFTPVNGMTYKVLMVHANETNEAVVFKMGDTVAPLYYEGEAVSVTNTWKDGEVIEIYYREAALESADETCFYAHSILNTFATGERVGGVGIDATPTEGSNNLLKSGGAKDAIGAIAEDMSELDEHKANKDGYYSQLTAGSAENLVGQIVDSEAYPIRPTAGAENEVASGVASVLGMEGNSCVWNQLVQNGDFSDGTTNWSILQNTCTVVVDGGIAEITKTFNDSGGVLYNTSVIANITHKYYICADSKATEGSAVYIGFLVSNGTEGGNTILSNSSTEFTKIAGIVTPKSDTNILSTRVGVGSTSIGAKGYVKNFMCIDLTLLGIDNLTDVAKVEEWLAQHVGTKPYYAYNAGTILSAKTLGFKTYGQNLLNPTTRQAKLIPYSWEENSNVYTIKNVPSGATATFTPDKTGVAETVDISGGTLDITNYGSGILELSAATADTYICMKWDEQKDDDVVPYEEHTYDFDVRKVYGKNNDVEYQCYPDGMKSAGSVHDTLTASEAVIRTRSVDLSTITIQTRYTGSVNKTISLNSPNSYHMSRVSILSQTYKYIGKVPGASVLDDPDNKEVGLYSYDNGTSSAAFILYIVLPVNSSITSNDVIVYSRATPITYTDLVYRDGGIDTPLGEVLLQMQVNNWSMEEQLVTDYDNGIPTSISATIKTKYSINAVEQLDTLNKTCYFADDVHANLQALLTCINTNCAETLGGTFSVSDTATNKVFAFSFTPNVESEP